MEHELAALREDLKDAISQSAARSEEFEKLQIVAEGNVEARRNLEADIQTFKESAADAATRYAALNAEVGTITGVLFFERVDSEFVL